MSDDLWHRLHPDGIVWVVLDRATGRRAQTAVENRRSGNLAILEYRARQARGGRPDISFEAVQALTLVPRTQLPEVERCAS